MRIPMKSQRASQTKSFSAVLMMLLVLGCATGSAVKMPESLPSSVKSYKDFTLWAGNPGMKKTGVFLNKMDVFTILATGSMDHCPRGGCEARDARPEHGWPLVARIGQGLYFGLLSQGLRRYDADGMGLRRAVSRIQVRVNWILRESRRGLNGTGTMRARTA